MIAVNFLFVVQAKCQKLFTSLQSTSDLMSQKGFAFMECWERWTKFVGLNVFTKFLGFETLFTRPESFLVPRNIKSFKSRQLILRGFFDLAEKY